MTTHSRPNLGKLAKPSGTSAQPSPWTQQIDGAFGSYLYRQRQRQGLSQAALAKAAAISAGYLSELENGKRRPPSQRVGDQLATALALSAHERHQLLCLAAAERAAATSSPLTPKLISLIQALHAAAPRLPERTIDKLIHTLEEAQM